MPEKEKKKTILTKEEREEGRQNITASIFFGSVIISLAIIIIGGIWAIGDIFSTQKFIIFLSLSLFSQIFISGLIVVGIFFLGLILLVLFRRGKRYVLKLLFEEKPELAEKETEEYLPAKIITLGALISFCVVFVGLVFALIESMVQVQIDPTGFWSFLGDLTGGSWVFLIGLLILILTGLILGAFYFWQNGYYVTINRILRYNQKIISPYTFSDKQKNTGRITFIAVILGILLIIFGVIWAIIDAAVLDWASSFQSLPYGVQFSFFGIFGVSLFGLLIGAMMVFKWGNNTINGALFGKKYPEMDKDSLSAKILTIGILVGICMIAISLIVWLIASSLGGTDIFNIFTTLQALSMGLVIMSIGIVITAFLVLILMFTFLINNGYGFIMEKVLKLEEGINKGIEKGEQKIKGKIDDMKKDK
ncbi:MAG: hypothetical protein ACTSWY_11310 [Promethearchaeota archaeon]